jgi:hypothetical protein
MALDRSPSATDSKNGDGSGPSTRYRAAETDVDNNPMGGQRWLAEKQFTG